jgi:hypothetical protein
VSSTAPQASSDTPDVTKVYENLRRRASRLRTKAARILTVIVGVLLSGITVFVTAGALANRETATSVDETRRATLASLLRERESLLGEQKRTTALLDNTRMTLLKEGTGQGPSGRAGQGPLTRVLQEQIADLLDRIATLQKQIAELDTRANQLSIPASVSVPREAQLASLISAISTRIGAILLLIFLVQILVPLYRYTVKLSTHYDACADTLELAFVHGEQIEHTKFVALLTALSPQVADFGAPPALPAAELVRMANEITSKR